MTDTPTTPTRVGDFSPQADSYARARPSYPPALVDQLIAHARLQPGAAIADLGAGTGIFTALLVGRGLHIHAIEPNDAMRAHAPALAGTTWTSGTFEATGLPDASMDWIVAAQAFHWADPKRALPELHRVLRPGSWFTCLWNNRQNDKHPVLQWTWHAIHRMVPAFEDNYRQLPWDTVLTSTGHFSTLTRHEMEHVVPMSAGRYVDIWRSHNRLNAAAGPRQFAAFIEALESHLASQNVQEVPVPYLCKAWSVRRVD